MNDCQAENREAIFMYLGQPMAPGPRGVCTIGTALPLSRSEGEEREKHVSNTCAFDVLKGGALSLAVLALPVPPAGGSNRKVKSVVSHLPQ
jgi:hypothetical protein